MMQCIKNGKAWKDWQEEIERKRESLDTLGLRRPSTERISALIIDLARLDMSLPGPYIANVYTKLGTKLNDHFPRKE